MLRSFEKEDGKGFPSNEQPPPVQYPSVNVLCTLKKEQVPPQQVGFHTVSKVHPPPPQLGARQFLRFNKLFE